MNLGTGELTEINLRNRYTFFLFKQSPAFNHQTLVNSSMEVLNLVFFNLSSFSQAVGLGAPLGGTFVLMGPDANAAPINQSSIPPGATVPPGVPVATGL